MMIDVTLYNYWFLPKFLRKSGWLCLIFHIQKIILPQDFFPFKLYIQESFIFFF